MSEISRRKLLKTLGCGAVIGTAAGAYPASCADWLEVERRELKLPNWDADGFKIVVLADFHLNSEQEVARAERAIDLALEETCDMYLLPGDFVNNSNPFQLQSIRKALGKFEQAKAPRFAVMGNHDYWAKDPSLVIEAVRSTPVQLLRNETVEIDGVTLAGIDDAIAGRDTYEFFPTHRVSKSLLIMLHEPDFVKHVPKHGSLQISGHSHGGQVCLPFGVPLHTPFGAKVYKSGFYPGAQIPLYVTRGVGTTGPNYRMFCRPEVSVLTLRSS